MISDLFVFAMAWGCRRIGVSQSLTLLIELYQQLQHILSISRTIQAGNTVAITVPASFGMLFLAHLTVFLHLPTCFTNEIIENDREYQLYVYIYNYNRYIHIDDFNQVAA